MPVALCQIFSVVSIGLLLIAATCVTLISMFSLHHVPCPFLSLSQPVFFSKTYLFISIFHNCSQIFRNLIGNSRIRYETSTFHESCSRCPDGINAGKTFIAQRAAQFQMENRGKHQSVLIGSYKNVSTDHLCEEADGKPYPLVRLGSNSQSSRLQRYKSSRIPLPQELRSMTRKLKRLEAYMKDASDALVFLWICNTSGTVPNGKPQLFRPVYQVKRALLER